MPKVGSINYKEKGRYKSIDVHYNQKLDFHIKDLPQHLDRAAKLFNNDLGQAGKDLKYLDHQDTFAGLKQDFFSVLNHYHFLESKVSTYWIELSMGVGKNIRMIKDSPSSWRGIPKWNFADSIDDLEWSIGIHFEILKKIEGETPTFYEVYFDKSHGLDPDIGRAQFSTFSKRMTAQDLDKLIPYSKEAHINLIKITMAMEKMADQMRVFFDNNPQTLKTLLESPNLKLLNT